MEKPFGIWLLIDMGALSVVSLQLIHTNHISPDGLRELGSFTTFFSKVSGTVFELNEKFLLIKDFNYDGKGLAPIFLAGTTGIPGGDGEVS